jgi:hypothetical protein
VPTTKVYVSTITHDNTKTDFATYTSTYTKSIPFVTFYDGAVLRLTSSSVTYTQVSTQTETDTETQTQTDFMTAYTCYITTNLICPILSFVLVQPRMHKH